MKKAIITLALGKRYQEYFRRYCWDLWSVYADVHEFDIHVITEPLDTSHRAFSRSPAWQKCLALSCPSIRKYDRVVWIDADVLINPMAPDVSIGVPVEKVGAVDDFAIPSKEDSKIVISRMHKLWVRDNIPHVAYPTPSEFHNQFGLNGQFDSVVQTGVMVLSPRYHSELFRHVYDAYEDRGSAIWNYEMRPLSYEILTRRMEHWLSPKFNMIWPYLKLLHYPFLNRDSRFLQKSLAMLRIGHRASLLSRCVTTAFMNNFFLHFSGGTMRDMKFIANIRTLDLHAEHPTNSSAHK